MGSPDTPRKSEAELRDEAIRANRLLVEAERQRQQQLSELMEIQAELKRQQAITAELEANLRSNGIAPPKK